MACTRPIAGWRAVSPNPTGRYSVVFDLGKGDPLRPMSVSCGGCASCCEEKARQWYMRCYHEAKMSDLNCFITLTYREPAPKDLSLRDVQLFLKRLRKTGAEFRYFIVGEYGPKNRRPHYHGLLFGWMPPDGVFAGGGSGKERFRSDVLQTVWSHGYVMFSPVNKQTIGYCVNYMAKDGDGYAGLVKPFQVMSRRPGLGRPYFERYWKDAASRDEVVIDGKPVRMPKYYLGLLGKKDPDREKQIREVRAVAADVKEVETYGRRMYGLAESSWLRAKSKTSKRPLEKL